MIIWTLYKLERNEQSLICIFNFNGENITHKSKNTSYKSSNDLQAVIGSITDTPDLHPAAGESTFHPSLSTTMDLTKDWSKDVRVVDLVGKVTTVGAVIQKQKKCKRTINHSRSGAPGNIWPDHLLMIIRKILWRHLGPESPRTALITHCAIKANVSIISGWWESNWLEASNSLETLQIFLVTS